VAVRLGAVWRGPCRLDGEGEDGNRRAPGCVCQARRRQPTAANCRCGGRGRRGAPMLAQGRTRPYRVATLSPSPVVGLPLPGGRRASDGAPATDRGDAGSGRRRPADAAVPPSPGVGSPGTPRTSPAGRDAAAAVLARLPLPSPPIYFGVVVPPGQSRRPSAAAHPNHLAAGCAWRTDAASPVCERPHCWGGTGHTDTRLRLGGGRVSRGVGFAPVRSGW